MTQAFPFNKEKTGQQLKFQMRKNSLNQLDKTLEKH